MSTETESNFIIKAIKNLFNPSVDTEGGSDLINKLHELNNSLDNNNSVFLVSPTITAPTRDELLATESGYMTGGSNNVIKGIRNANYLGSVSEGGSETEEELIEHCKYKMRHKKLERLLNCIEDETE